MCRDYWGISDNVIYRSQYKLIGSCRVTIGLTQRVNDFETVNLARNTKIVVTIDNFSGRRKLSSFLRYCDILHRSIFLSPFFVPSYVLL